MDRKLPLGIQDFEVIQENGYQYVDKTKLIYKLIRLEKGSYFLSRPRRFGKSLLISTLGAIFKAKSHLFSNLWLGNSGYEFHEYPVITLDMSLFPTNSIIQLKQGINSKLLDIAKNYSIEIDIEDLSPETALNKLITALSEKNKVLILIDECDSPLINQINNKKKLLRIKSFLKRFYGIIKADKNVRFTLLTGTSGFSGSNNLTDISYNEDYAAILGYSQEELEKHFNFEVESLASKLGQNREQILAQIKYWYNGYRFTDKNLQVYNPHSCLLLFFNKKFKNYWFETGTPSFLFDLFKEKDFGIFDLEKMPVSERALSSNEIENLSIVPLLFQTGYVTISKYLPREDVYYLGFPNKEVERYSFKAGQLIEKL